MVLVSFVGSYLSMLWRITVTLTAGDPRPRVHADVVVVTLDNHLFSTAVSLVVPIPMMVVVVVMVLMIVVPRFRRTTPKIVILLHRGHTVLHMMPSMMMVMVVVVVVVVVAMARVRQRGSCIDMDVIVVSFDDYDIVSVL